MLVVAAMVAGGVARNHVEVGPRSPLGRDQHAAMLASREGVPAISESQYFYQLTQLLEREYVDPVKDEQKLAVGAVRGMVGSLADPNAVFMNPQQFKAFIGQRSGVFEGIGAEVGLRFDDAQLKKARAGSRSVDVLLMIPDLMVTAVAPGSPAEKAGLHAGDRITSVNGRWVLSSSEIRRLRLLQAQVQAGKANGDELIKLRDDLRAKTKHNATPMRARDILTQGFEGSVKLAWLRGDKPMEAQMAKSKTVVPAVKSGADGVIALRFFRDAPQALKQIVKGGKPLTIDLRQSTQGDFAAMQQCLAVLAPAGDYGTLVTERSSKPSELKVAKGAAKVPNLKLIVDGSTRGAAEVFALALSSRGYARLQGSKTAGNLAWIEVFSLPDGSGYTLPVGVYRPDRASQGAARS